jgi:hypothetical protein
MLPVANPGLWKYDDLKKYRLQGSTDPAVWLAREDERRQVGGNRYRGIGQFLGELSQSTLNFGGYMTWLGSVSGRITRRFFMDLRPTRNA